MENLKFVSKILRLVLYIVEIDSKDRRCDSKLLFMNSSVKSTKFLRMRLLTGEMEKSVSPIVFRIGNNLHKGTKHSLVDH